MFKDNQDFITQVNDELVPIDYLLRNEDRVITLTDNLSYGSREGWIEKANTMYAEKKICSLVIKKQR